MQLTQYFDGKRTQFALPLDPAGTQFQKRVWDVLLTIPFGTTKCYSEVATLLGNTNASRAVGMANFNNPIAIIIPCHRVIGKNGKLTGYAAGIEIKEKLLRLENHSGAF